MFVQDQWFKVPKDWEAWLQTATLLDLEGLEPTLPNDDLGNYRRVLLAVERSEFQMALNLLEEGGSFFDDEGFAVGLHAYVRQRLGLKLTLKGPCEGNDHAKEDSVYWYLAWTLTNVFKKHWTEARQSLFEAMRLAQSLGMTKTLTLLQQVKTHLHQPHCGLKIIAPPLAVLDSPQAFDTLRKDRTSFARLAVLGEEAYLEPIQLCRYAQFLLYEEQYEQALVTIEKAKPQNNLLAYGIRMAILASLEWFDLLHAMIENFRPGPNQPLEAEGTILAYEQTAFYFAMVKKDYRLAYANLHRAEALALEHALPYRLGVIRSHIEAVANMSGDVLTLDPLLESNSGTFRRKSVRNRFDSLLRASNVDAIRTFVRQHQLEQEDLFLAQGTLEYHKATEGQGSFHKVASLISEHEPDHPESRFFWSLLLAQVFSAIGDADGRANPERILKVLEASLARIEYLGSVVPVAANIYPQGLAMATYLLPRLEPSRGRVATVWSDDVRDGLRLNGKKIVTITKPVREAMVLDDLYRSRERFSDVTSYKTGHTENKLRLERSLEKVNLNLHEITTIGGVYRGVFRLGKTLEDKTIVRRSEELRLSSSFLSQQVTPQEFQF